MLLVALDVDKLSESFCKHVCFGLLENLCQFFRVFQLSIQLLVIRTSKKKKALLDRNL